MKNFKVSGEVNHRNKVQHFALKLYKGFLEYYKDDPRHLELITVKDWITPVKYLLFKTDSKGKLTKEPFYTEQQIIKLLEFNFSNKSEFKNQILNTNDLKNKIGKLILEYNRQ